MPVQLRSLLRRMSVLGGLLPFLAYITVFLLVPAVAVIVGAFKTPDGHATLHNFHIATTGVYRTGYERSIKLSLIASIVPAILGFVIAQAIHKSPPDAFLRKFVVSLSGVFANFGGVPLAFLFISTWGPVSVTNSWLGDIGIHWVPNVHSFNAVAAVYLYFQIPLMVLVILPAFEGLKPAWREASDNLGGNGLSYWRHVAGPAILPAFLGATLLLFGSAFSAYATAEALTSGTIPLTPIQIGSFLNGNVLPGQENVGKALAAGMLVIIAVVMGIYAILQRRAARWASA
ncbi:MAG TPA: ABC transporter permease subunit [Mycobacteriales bacterium]|nr:ABC transporter permease subunit [Mycobacteriales bacterium]